MKLFTTQHIRQIEAATIEETGISSFDLMERAAERLTHSICKRWDASLDIKVFAGAGNNGGDALAVARMLAEKGYRVEVYHFNPSGKISPDCQTNRELLELMPEVVFHEITDQFSPPELNRNHLVIDGLFGSGLNKPLSGGFAAVVKHINASTATVVSIDIPSGLMGEDNTDNHPQHIIQADLTLSLQFPKIAFLFAENAPYIGEWEVLDIGLSQSAMDEIETPYSILERTNIQSCLKPRSQFAHKGHFGHALLIAGSQGMAGAAILAGKACLRSGVGLVSVHTPSVNLPILQTALPEAMVIVDPHPTSFSTPTATQPYQAIGIGPGLAQAKETETALLRLLSQANPPMVVDADALNLLANYRHELTHLPEGSILTPHSKEFERLVGQCRSSYERLTKALELARIAEVYIVLKGAYSAIITPDGRCLFNSTGNPGMATAGSGDVLTGILTALLAQGYTSEETCTVGVYTHGLAGDLAQHTKGEMGMIASDIVGFLPKAWQLISE